MPGHSDLYVNERDAELLNSGSHFNVSTAVLFGSPEGTSYVGRMTDSVIWRSARKTFEAKDSVDRSLVNVNKRWDNSQMLSGSAGHST